MIWWEKEFLKKLEQQGVQIHLYKWYVDDTVLILRCIDRKLEYVKENDNEGRLRLGERESNEATDVHAMKLLKRMGDKYPPVHKARI